MPDESFPIEIGGELLSLRFEDRDVREIEKTLSIFVAFHPTQRTYDNAALFLWRGLRRTTDNGELVYAIQQGPQGKELAFQMVKTFCNQFPMGAGMVVLYGSIHNALVLTGWFGKPEEQPKQDGKPEETDAPKNSHRPTKRPTKESHTGSVTSPPGSSKE